jgi:predicted ATP-grasp superfamily ATP-dependent carboligase
MIPTSALEKVGTTARRTVLVTDAEQRAALAVVRSLGRAGHIVYVCSRSGKSLAGASRYANAEYHVADPLGEPERFTDDVRRIVADTHCDTIIPITEAALLALLPARQTFGDVLIPFADAGVFQRISDKSAVLQAAQRVGIAIPAQHKVENQTDCEKLDLDRLEYPLVVKPARSVAGAANARQKFTVEHAATPADLHQILQRCPAEAYPLLLQQRIVGPGVGIFLLLWNGDIVAAFSHRRIREKPPAGGVSVYRESTALDPTLMDRSRALLDSFGWTGVAMIEYKVDAQTGVPYLMEINGRFWGSLQLAVDAGVDFPLLLLQAASGQRPVPVTTYRADVRSRWWWGDVDHLITRLRHSDMALALPPGSPSRWNAVRAFLRRDARDRDEIAQPGDRAPFLRETWQWFGAGR